MNGRRLTLLFSLLLVPVQIQCAGGDGDPGADGDGDGDGDTDGDGDGDGTWDCFSANDCDPGQWCNEFHRCVWPPGGDGDADADADGGLDGDVEPWIPPEVEQEFGPPSSGDRFVYIALPDLDAVARVDSETLDVNSLPVGDRPGQLATAAGQDLAVVLNEGSDSVSILRVLEDDGEDQIVTLPTPPRLNRLAVGPLGQHALAWFELLSPDAEDVGSFQDVALIRMIDGDERVVGVSVGFRPREVLFAPDGATAWIVTEDGLSILDLETVEEGFVAPTIAVRLDPFTESIPDEVVVSPDGTFAFARWFDLPVVRSIDLSTGDIVDTPLSGIPTDIDILDGGARLLAVVRETSRLVLMDVPGALGDPEALEYIECGTLTVGSAVVDPEGRRALVFTNAMNQKAIALVDLESGEIRIALLRKGIRNVALSPDGETALILHNRVPGEPSPDDDFETQLDHRWGFTMLDLDSLFAKLQITEADPGGFTFLPDSSAAYLIVADPASGLRRIATADLDSFIVTDVTMGSNPLEVGNVPGTGRVYVSQEHELGRISFIHVETGEVRTVTGFQLNSGITE